MFGARKWRSVRMKVRLLLLVFFVFSLSFVVAVSNYQNYYDLKLSFNDGVVSLGSLDIGFVGELDKSFGGWSVSVFDSRGNLLNSVFFDVNNEIIFETVNPETGLIDGGETVILEKFDLSLKVPYYENASELVVFNERLDEVLVVDVAFYSRQGISRLGELGNWTVGESREIEKLDGQIVEQPDNLNGESFDDIVAGYWWVLLIVLLLLVMLFVKLFFKNKKSKK